MLAIVLREKHDECAQLCVARERVQVRKIGKQKKKKYIYLKAKFKKYKNEAP